MKLEKKSKKVGYENELLIFCIWVYQHINMKLPRNFLGKKRLEQEYRKEKFIKIIKSGGLNILSEEYYISMLFIGFFIGSIILLFSIIALVYLLVFNQILFFGVSTLLISFYLFLGLFIFLISFFIFVFSYPNILRSQREKEINAAIPKILPYMKIASSNLSFAKIIELLPKFINYSNIKVEFDKCVYYHKYLGYDMNTSVRKAIETCPSKELRDLLIDSLNISNSGGNLNKFYAKKVKQYDLTSRIMEKKYVEILLVYSQIYIILLLIAPLLFVIFFSLLNIIDLSNLLGSANSTFSYTEYFKVIVLFFILPIVYGIFGYIIYVSKPLIHRIKVSKKLLESEK
jgi:archaellum biogenesis protein FlaJ (TadC family)